jgi:HK97 family phage portal protein
LGFFSRLKEAAALMRGRDPRAVYSDRSVLAGIFQPLNEMPVDAAALGSYERKNPSIFRLVQTIASDAASVRLQLVRLLDGGKKHEVIDDHPAIKAFDFPNPVDPSYIYWESVYADLLTYGNSYTWLGEITPRRGPGVILRIPPEQIKVIPDRKKIVKNYEWTPAQSGVAKETYKVEEILHFKTRNLSTPYLGMPPLERLRPYLLIEDQMLTWNWNRFKNAIPTSLILQTEQPVAGGTETKEKLGRYIKQKMSGVEHAGEPLILDGDKWKVDTIARASEDEIAFIKGLQHIRSTYAMCYGTPPSQMSDWSDSFRSNSRDQVKDYYIGTVQAWHRLVLAFLNEIWLRRFWPKENNLRFRYDYGEVPILAFSELEKAQVMEILVRGAMLQPEEGRSAAGYDTTNDPAMKKFYWNGKELGKEPAPAPNRPKADGEPDEPDEPGPKDNKTKGLRLLQRQEELEDEEFFLLLDEDQLFDLEEEQREVERKFTPIIGVIVLSAALSWLALHKKEEKFDRTRAEYIDFVNRQSIKIQRALAVETIERIRNVIRLANSQQLPLSRVRRMLAEIFEERLSQFELDRIARTESHQASEGGAYLAMLFEPSVTQKRWVTERDLLVRGPKHGETRADHIDLNDKIVPVETVFVDRLSGARLRFPGDADGAVSGADVINCRCVATDATNEEIDRDEFWYKRDNNRGTYARTIRAAAAGYFREFEKRIVGRLALLGRREAG